MPTSVHNNTNKHNKTQTSTYLRAVRTHFTQWQHEEF